MDYDVIIIGAGPAGAMAAVTLAASGARVAVLEKERLPRDKACGGGLPGDAEILFDWDIKPVIERKISQLRVLGSGPVERTYPPLGRPRWLTVDRRRFDAHLIERALSVGKSSISLMEGLSVFGVEESADRVTVYGPGGRRFEAPWLIAADGVYSPTARKLGLVRKRTVGWGIDAAVEVDNDTMQKEADRVTARFGCTPSGYGWIVPKKALLSCGVMSWKTRKHLDGALDAFLENHFPRSAVRIVRKKIHPIPRFEGIGRIATRRVCLAGDAAGLVDPISGEGIVYALKSGIRAAEAALGLLEASCRSVGPAGPQPPEGFADLYAPKVDQEIGAFLSTLNRLAVPVFEQAPEFFFQKFFIEGNGYAGAYRYLAERISAGRKAETPAAFSEEASSSEADARSHRQRVASYYDRFNTAYEHHLGATFQAALVGSGEGEVDPAASNLKMARSAGIRPGFRVLDAGCGVCGPAVDIAGRMPGVRIDGITLSGVQARRARSIIHGAGMAGRVTVQVADYHRLPFAEETFDAIVYLESACCSDDPQSMFAEAFRVLKPGGRIYVKDNFISPDSAAAWGRRKLHQMFVQKITALEETIDSLDGAGFERIESENLTERISLQRCLRVWNNLADIPGSDLGEATLNGIPLFFAQVVARRPEAGDVRR